MSDRGDGCENSLKESFFVIYPKVLVRFLFYLGEVNQRLFTSEFLTVFTSLNRGFFTWVIVLYQGTA